MGDLNADGDLLRRLKEALPRLEAELTQLDAGETSVEGVYRFYHQSFKVYRLQDATVRIVELLQSVMPERKLNDWFTLIVSQGTGRTFELQDNKRWLEITRPMVEAFFHARYFLEMAVTQAKQLEGAPSFMPTGWAAVLYLYNMR